MVPGRLQLHLPVPARRARTKAVLRPDPARERPVLLQGGGKARRTRGLRYRRNDRAGSETCARVVHHSSNRLERARSLPA